MNILITGASSGIGRSLAELYATDQNTLLLMGRNMENLKSIKDFCTAKGSLVHIKKMDVTDRIQMEKAILEWDQTYPIDLVIANAGVRASQADPDRDEVDRVLKTNVDGVLNSVFPLIKPMKLRRKGHIAVVSSLAAYRAFPFRGAYTASKAAVKMFCEAWRVELAPYGITVSTICPGFVETPLTANRTHSMPFIMSATDSALRIEKGLKSKMAIIAYPFPVFLTMRILQCLPDRLVTYIMGKILKRL